MSDKKKDKRIKWTYSEGVKAKIVELYAAGVPIAKMNEYYAKIPGSTVLYDWFGKYPDLREALDAREKDRANSFVEGAIDVVDTEVDPQRARIRADIRMKVAAKYNRAKYGDKLDINHNHKVEITSVLEDASARVLSLSDQSQTPIDVEFVQLTDNKEQSELCATDSKSSALTNDKQQAPIAPDDKPL